MLNRWLQTVKAAKISTIRKIELFASLDVMYRTGNRPYHNMEHIEHCFRELDSLLQVYTASKTMAFQTEIEMTFWLHDAFYDIKRGDNEERCAELAEDICSELSIFAPRVGEFILLTKHKKAPEDEAGKIITDIDLSILGQSYKAYRIYQERIYKEYNAESFWKVFAEKRIQVLESLLERNNKRIYFLDHFYNKCGKDAFTNMNREIVEMKEKLK